VSRIQTLENKNQLLKEKGEKMKMKNQEKEFEVFIYRLVNDYGVDFLFLNATENMACDIYLKFELENLKIPF